jgi:hypothetical protein
MRLTIDLFGHGRQTLPVNGIAGWPLSFPLTKGKAPPSNATTASGM